MNGQKTEFRFFDVMDYEKEAQYLSRMHASGWKFVHVSFPGLYHFVKCEPEHVKYCLDYNREGADHLDEYKQMFADMGWEYLFDFVGYSYFRKPETGEAEDDIFCDDDSRWDMMKRIFRGRVIPLIVIFFAVVLPNAVRGVLGLEERNPVIRGINIVMVLIFFLYLSIFVRFTVKYLAFKKKMGR